VENQQNSKYKDWYWVEAYDNPETPENEFKYKGWFGVADLPEIRETIKVDHTKGIKPFEGDIYDKDAKQHIFNVTKRWLDPNGDGDPSDGVDGFRLDVAAEVPLGFWRDYRKFVRDINPDAYLLGEVWWEKWPDKLLDPKPYLGGDIFDAVMNYRWYRSARHFFNQSPDEIPVSEFIDSLKSFSSNLSPQHNYAMMNLTASHDAPRVLTSLYNNNKYKMDSKPTPGNEYKINKPDHKTNETLKLLLAQQFTFVGAPHIWAGDEMGMWGADDPSNRKPLIWPEYDFEDETTHPFGQPRPVDEVMFDRVLFDFYRHLIKIRKEKPVLAFGDLEYLIIDDDKKILAYSRFDDQNEVIAVFNTTTEPEIIKVPVKTLTGYSDVLNGYSVVQEGQYVVMELPGRKSAILAGE
jgi:glycosidase